MLIQDDITTVFASEIYLDMAALAGLTAEDHVGVEDVMD
jgi:hypothetical protein